MDKLILKPITEAAHLAGQPLAWSIKEWGEGKEEFSAQNWRDFYSNALNANYGSWDLAGEDQELIYLAINNLNGHDEVVAAIALCDFDDFVELKKYKPWIAAFIVKEDLRGLGIGSLVLELMEEKIKTFGIQIIYLWTEGASEYYKNSGYIQIDTLIKGARRIEVFQKKLF